jgi:hypothetical protein
MLCELGDGIEQGLLWLQHLLHQELHLRAEFIGPRGSLLQADPTQVTDLRQESSNRHLPSGILRIEAERI